MKNRITVRFFPLFHNAKNDLWYHSNDFLYGFQRPLVPFKRPLVQPKTTSGTEKNDLLYGGKRIGGTFGAKNVEKSVGIRAGTGTKTGMSYRKSFIRTIFCSFLRGQSNIMTKKAANFRPSKNDLWYERGRFCPVAAAEPKTTSGTVGNVQKRLPVRSKNAIWYGFYP
jgi:hypothetical protein